MVNYWRQPTIKAIWDRCHRSKDGYGSIELRVTGGGKNTYFSLGIKVKKNQFKDGYICNRPDAHILNNIIQKMISDIREVIMKQQEEGYIDVKKIPAALKRLRAPRQNFVEYCYKRLRVRNNGNGKDSKQRSDRFFIRCFKDWGQIVEFADVNDYKIVEFDNWLRAKDMTAYSRWQNYHRYLNSCILDAVAEGLLTRNPYKFLKIKKDKSRGINKYLTLEEFEAIENVDLPTKSLERVRDLFVFQTYTAMAYADLALFNAKEIVELKGKKVYVSMRRKTGETYTIPLLQPALAILSKYNNKLPMLSNVKYNEYLKVVAQAAGIDKPISSHWARHTGATLLLNGGVPMHIVSKILGHAKIAITESTYAKTLDESIVDAIAEYEKNAEKKKK